MPSKANDRRLSVNIAGVTFKHPFFLASGPTTHSADQLERGCEEGWSGASIKLTFDPAPYINREPRYAYFDPAGLFAFTAEKRINLDQALKLVEESRPRVSDDFVIMANYSYVGDEGVEGWVNMARAFEQAGCHVLEVNMGCPNMSFNVALTGEVHEGGPQSGASMGMVPELVYEVIKATVDAVSIPVFVKLTPEGGRLGEVSQAAYRAGAVAVGSNANRLAFAPVDIWNPKQSVIHLQEQVSLTCMSGPWCKPLALRDIFEIRKRNGPAVRAIATGGCETWQDAVEMAFFGADLVGVCTAVLVHGYGLVNDLTDGVLRYLDRMGFESWEAMRDLLVNEVTSSEKLTLYPGHARIKDTGLAAPCKFACPNQVPAQAYVRKVAERDFHEAYRLITSRDPLQSVCGYICAHPCEKACTRGDMDDPIRIRDIKRFVLEHAEKQGWKPEVDRLPASGKKVAVIGSGPAGMTCAWDLARAGHAVTVFEAAEKPGGMLRYGIPAFRLTAHVLDKEIAALGSLGVNIECGQRLGRDLTLASLKEQGFDAVFVGIGAQAGRKLDVPGEEAQGVVSAVDFLTQVRRRGKASVGTRVAVVGGGYTAVDAARTALRLGAKEVFLCYRRTRDEMPAIPEEVWEAEDEGVRVIYLVAPIEILTQGKRAAGLRMVIHTLAAPDASGRRRPDPVAESEFTLPCDMVINALGQVVAEAPDGLALARDGSLACDPVTGATAMQGVFAGGDAATGADSVIAAVASGRRAAVSIDRFLSGENAFLSYDPVLTEVSRERVLARTREVERELRVPLAMRPAEDRKQDFEVYTPALSEEEAVREASRCLNCGCGAGCGLCARICSNFAVARETPDSFAVDEEKCVACGMCFRRCPNQNIEMVRLPGTI
jgi:NADPH-dependent glutamate synthase beta subunit-like oxidoreductase/dihydroorotate dehydrogenase/Pyruvate/2-oxoacid:ferredoxin oxidoreductase delta subunit